jgi:hypothetical protein
MNLLLTALHNTTGIAVLLTTLPNNNTTQQQTLAYRPAK